jgi:hypothetical protein
MRERGQICAELLHDRNQRQPRAGLRHGVVVTRRGRVCVRLRITRVRIAGDPAAVVRFRLAGASRREEVTVISVMIARNFGPFVFAVVPYSGSRPRCPFFCTRSAARYRHHPAGIGPQPARRTRFGGW